jgi:hypothetical protein
MPNLTLMQCGSCNGIYPRAQRDGTEYYHVCPPRRVTGSAPAPTKDDPLATAPVFAPIDQPRNENVVGLDENKKPIIAAAGKGAAVVTDPAVIAAFQAPPEVP